MRSCAENGRLPVVNFTAGGIATPADAALMMQLGVDGVFVGSGIFKAPTRPRWPGDRRGDDALRTTRRSSRRSRGLGDAMAGTEIAALGENGLLQTRGW